MRPIETEYRGVTFRSRLEARWAVFFDVMEIAWVYEPSGYSTGTYQPDFLLPEVEFLAEVKPVWPTKMEVDKCRDAHRKTGLSILLLIGFPDFRFYWAVGSEPSEWPFYIEMHDGELRADEDNAYTPDDDFSVQYHNAVHAAKTARFDGYDGDRKIINLRYAA